VFTGHRHRLPARRQQPQRWTLREDVGDESSDGVEQVLAVVEHDEQLTIGDGLDHGRPHRPSVTGNDAQRRRDQRLHVVRIGGRGEIHEQRPTGELRLQLLGDGEGEAGLPDPPGPSERDQSPGDQHALELVDLIVSPDEARNGGRQVSRRLPGIGWNPRDAVGELVLAQQRLVQTGQLDAG
jgi:hypothetical protein